MCHYRRERRIDARLANVRQRSAALRAGAQAAVCNFPPGRRPALHYAEAVLGAPDRGFNASRAMPLQVGGGTQNGQLMPAET